MMTPQPAIISSFNVKGLAEAINNWTIPIRNIELYAFMQSDFSLGFGFKPHVGQTNALRFLANNFKSHQHVEKFARKLDKTCKGFNIVAFASFLPEIMAHDGNEAAWKSAQQAICSLVKIGRELRIRGHKIETIEVVAGNKLNGVWSAKDKSDVDVYVVNRMTREKSLVQLLQRLEPIAEIAVESKRIQIAVEFEPGPLFTIGQIESLREFCLMVDGHESEAVRKVIGVNLDVPHWDFLGKISPDSLRNKINRPILNRILHAHICDHSSGHFGDCTIGTFNAKERFGAWIKLLGDLYKERKVEAAHYSGFVSCEMEACKGLAFVSDCVSQLLSLIRTYGVAI